jgi:hypothetical protein
MEMRVKSESLRKRHAMQLAGELPSNEEDALAILAYMHVLVRGYLREELQPPVASSPVLAFSSASERR